jgi:hypothetical protein
MNYINWTFLLSILILVVSILMYYKEKQGSIHDFVTNVRTKLGLKNEYFRRRYLDDNRSMSASGEYYRYLDDNRSMSASGEY